MEFEMSGVSTLEEELESSLQCPVCLLIPRTLPVPACPSGHIMCQVILTSDWSRQVTWPQYWHLIGPGLPGEGEPVPHLQEATILQPRPHKQYRGRADREGGTQVQARQVRGEDEAGGDHQTRGDVPREDSQVSLRQVWPGGPTKEVPPARHGQEVYGTSEDHCGLPHLQGASQMSGTQELWQGWFWHDQEQNIYPGELYPLGQTFLHFRSLHGVEENIHHVRLLGGGSWDCRGLQGQDDPWLSASKETYLRGSVSAPGQPLPASPGEALYSDMWKVFLCQLWNHQGLFSPKEVGRWGKTCVAHQPGHQGWNCQDWSVVSSQHITGHCLWSSWIMSDRNKHHALFSPWVCHWHRWWRMSEIHHQLLRTSHYSSSALRSWSIIKSVPSPRYLLVSPSRTWDRLSLETHHHPSPGPSFPSHSPHTYFTTCLSEFLQVALYWKWRTV